MNWTPEVYAQAEKILKRYRPEAYGDALKKCAEELGTTTDSVRRAFSHRGQGSPKDFCQGSPAPLVQRLATLTRKPHSSVDLCNTLDISPRKLEKLIEEAQARGMSVQMDEGGSVGRKNNTVEDRVQDAGVKPVVGGEHKVGVISDTHLGSRFCLRAQLKDFIHHAYAEGVREILHPGDVVDGDYRHAKFEMTHMGLEEQARDLLETLPQLPGLTYHGITGNHDYTFTDSAGIDVGAYLSRFFVENGRTDLKFYGDRSAFVRLRGAVFHLWHPRSGNGYAKSYKVQRIIETYSSGEKPHVLLCGHWHVFCHVMERGVHGIACPTFQGGGSAFSKSLGGAPAIGGLVLSWGLTEDGTMRDFNLKYRSYFEVEQPSRIEDGFRGGSRAVYQGMAR